MRCVQIAEFAWSVGGVSASAVPPPNTSAPAAAVVTARAAAHRLTIVFSWFSGLGEPDGDDDAELR
jgi:hypothetical protein